MTPKRLVAVALLALAALTPIASAGAVAAEGTVSISGRAYAFNHMDTYLAGATIRTREFPKLSATTDANGDYVLDVPDDANVTPYIEPPDGYNQIDLQTFHTRGKDIPNANFQTPGDLEYNGLAAILGVPLGDDGRPQQCVIVTTASDRDVRGVDYDTFRARTPHGVPGATARTYPRVPGPTYFNESVIPDTTKTETSEDGGMVWTAVPAGTYRVVTKHPDTRFASFLATCAPGRVINASPPWGAYQLTRGERPLGAGTVAATVGAVKTQRLGGGNRRVAFTIEAGERVDVQAYLTRGAARTARQSFRSQRLGGKFLHVPVGGDFGRGKAILRVEIEDAAGDHVNIARSVALPSRH